MLKTTMVDKTSLLFAWLIVIIFVLFLIKFLYQMHINLHKSLVVIFHVKQVM